MKSKLLPRVICVTLLLLQIAAWAIDVPIISSAGSLNLCSGGSILLTASPQSGGSYTAGTTYIWYKDAVAISGATASSYTASIAGSYTVKVTLSAENATSAGVSVVVNPTPLVITSPGQTACGTSISLAASSKSLLFNGTNSYVNFTGSNNPKRIIEDVYNDFTIEFWVYPLATHEIDPENNNATTGTSGQAFPIFPTNTNLTDRAGMGVSVGTNGVSVYESGTSYLSPLLVWQGTLSGWTHVAVSYINKQPSLYINGVFVRKGLVSTRAYVHPSVGNFAGGAYGYFKGYVDEIRYWNSINTEAEIAAKKQKIAVSDNRLVGYWRMEEGSGTLLSDLSGRANHGTLTNSPTWYSSVNESSFSWSPSTGLNTTSGSAVTANSASPLTYTVAVSDLNSCASSASLSICTPTPVLEPSGPLTVCDGSSVTLSTKKSDGTLYTGTVAFQWFRNGQAITGATTSSYTATDNGQYSVNVMQSGATSSSNRAQFTQYAKPLVLASADVSNGGSTNVTLEASSTCLYFDGNSSITMSSWTYPVFQNIFNDFTIEFWAYAQSTHEIDAQSTTVIGGSTGQRYVNYPFWGDNWGNGHAGVGVSMGTNGVSVYEHGNGYMPALLVWQGTLVGWNHVAVVYKNSQPSLYVNGEFKKTGLTGTRPYVHPIIAQLGGGVYGNFNGYLDEFRVWKVARTPAQITANMNKMVAVNNPSLVDYWRMDEGTGTTINDLTDTKNKGTWTTYVAWKQMSTTALQWSPSTALSSTTGNTVTANPSTTTTYTISTTSNGGTCASSASATVFSQPIPIDTNVAPGQTGPGGVGNATTNRLWLDAKAQGTLSNGAKLSAFKDRSGNGLDFVQSSIANQPSMATGSVNGQPAVHFDRTSANQYFENGSISMQRLISNDNTILAVAKANSAALNGTTDQAACVFCPVGNHSGIQFLGYPTITSLQTLQMDNTPSPLSYAKSIAQGTWALASMQSDESYQKLDFQSFVNGEKLGSTSNTKMMYDYIMTRIGAANASGSGSWPLNGDIAEIIVYDYKLNDAQRIIVENYLAAKYGLTILNDFYTNTTHIKDVQGIGNTDGNTTNKHPQCNGSKELSLTELNSSLNVANEFLLCGHNSETNNVVVSDLGSGIKRRWERVWYLEKSSGSSIDAKLSFQMKNASDALSAYLLYRSAASGNFSIVQSGTQALRPVIENGTIASFSLANGSVLNTGYYTIGFTGTTLTVSQTTDNGTGSLRQAILDANQNPSVATIVFTGLQGTIQLASPLPSFKYPIVIDGTTRTNYDPNNDQTWVQIQNAPSQNVIKGLTFSKNCEGSSIKGIKMSGFTSYGIDIQSEGVSLEKVKVE